MVPPPRSKAKKNPNMRTSHRGNYLIQHLTKKMESPTSPTISGKIHQIINILQGKNMFMQYVHVFPALNQLPSSIKSELPSGNWTSLWKTAHLVQWSIYWPYSNMVIVQFANCQITIKLLRWSIYNLHDITLLHHSTFTYIKIGGLDSPFNYL